MVRNILQDKNFFPEVHGQLHSIPKNHQQPWNIQRKPKNPSDSNRIQIATIFIFVSQFLYTFPVIIIVVVFLLPYTLDLLTLQHPTQLLLFFSAYLFWFLALLCLLAYFLPACLFTFQPSYLTDTKRKKNHCTIGLEFRVTVCVCGCAVSSIPNEKCSEGDWLTVDCLPAAADYEYTNVWWSCFMHVWVTFRICAKAMCRWPQTDSQFSSSGCFIFLHMFFFFIIFVFAQTI